MKLLPHLFKWIGLTIFLLGFIVGSIDDGRQEFMDGYNDASDHPIEYEVTRILPNIVSQIAEYATFLGLLLYILSRNKREDEFAQKMRYEAAFIVLVLTLGVILVLYILNPEFKIRPTDFLELQMLMYLILRSVRRRVILGE